MLTLSRVSAIILVTHSPTARSGASPISRAGPVWPVILLCIVGYKLGEALAGVMATPLYISLGFSLDEIAAVSKLVGFFAIVAGALIDGVVTARFGIRPSLMLCKARLRA